MECRLLIFVAVWERDGYVPNVVYSCGALLHGQTLVLPYGCSDSSIRIAFVDLPELIACSHLADSVEKQLVGQAPLEIPKSSRAADNSLAA